MSDMPVKPIGILSFATVAEALRKMGRYEVTCLDLAAVEHVDSAGLALLLELKRRAAVRGGCLIITGASTQVCEISDFFGLEPVLNLHTQSLSAA